jgi:hypothetical protein
MSRAHETVMPGPDRADDDFCPPPTTVTPRRPGMKLLASLLAALTFFMFAGSPVAASGSPAVTKTYARMVVASFRIHVLGHGDSLASYWVAWGPLGDKFGLVQLQRRSGSTFAADQLLPASGQTIFAYLVGRGVVHTAHGPVPGDLVVTIKRVGPVSMAHLHLSTVEWSGTSG